MTPIEKMFVFTICSVVCFAVGTAIYENAENKLKGFVYAIMFGLSLGMMAGVIVDAKYENAEVGNEEVKDNINVSGN